MGKLIAGILLLVWMLLTLILVCTIFGMYVVFDSEWGGIGKSLTQKITQ